jgi:hypothetical protein
MVVKKLRHLPKDHEYRQELALWYRIFRLQGKHSEIRRAMTATDQMISDRILQFRIQRDMRAAENQMFLEMTRPRTPPVKPAKKPQRAKPGPRLTYKKEIMDSVLAENPDASLTELQKLYADRDNGRVVDVSAIRRARKNLSRET